MDTAPTLAPRAPLPAQAFDLRGSEARPKESLLPSELPPPQLHDVSLEQASRRPEVPLAPGPIPAARGRLEALVLWGRDKVAPAYDRPLHLSAKTTSNFLRADTWAGWVGTGKGDVGAVPLFWASEGSHS